MCIYRKERCNGAIAVWSSNVHFGRRSWADIVYYRKARGRKHATASDVWHLQLYCILSGSTWSRQALGKRQQDWLPNRLERAHATGGEILRLWDFKDFNAQHSNFNLEMSHLILAAYAQGLSGMSPVEKEHGTQTKYAPPSQKQRQIKVHRNPRPKKVIKKSCWWFIEFRESWVVEYNHTRPKMNSTCIPWKSNKPPLFIVWFPSFSSFLSIIIHKGYHPFFHWRLVDFQLVFVGQRFFTFMVKHHLTTIRELFLFFPTTKKQIQLKGPFQLVSPWN